MTLTEARDVVPGAAEDRSSPARGARRSVRLVDRRGRSSEDSRPGRKSPGRGSFSPGVKLTAAPASPAASSPQRPPPILKPRVDRRFPSPAKETAPARSAETKPAARRSRGRSRSGRQRGGPLRRVSMIPNSSEPEARAAAQVKHLQPLVEHDQAVSKVKKHVPHWMQKRMEKRARKLDNLHR